MAFCVYLILHAIEWGQLKKKCIALTGTISFKQKH